MVRVERLLVLIAIFSIVVIVVKIALLFRKNSEESCQFLNSVRDNVTACCRYPRLVIWTWEFKECFKNCVKEATSDQVCCVQTCCYKKLGVVSDDWNSPAGINVTGLIYSFMLSIGNDSQWEPLITQSVVECNQKHFSGESSQLRCDILPERMYDVITCVYTMCFVKCPTWNPYGLENCHRTYQYVNDCVKWTI